MVKAHVHRHQKRKPTGSPPKSKKPKSSKLKGTTLNDALTTASSVRPNLSSSHSEAQEIAEKDWAADRRYGVVIDAGSSGSRVQVYSWKDHAWVRAHKSIEELRGVLPTVERGDRQGLKWQFKIDPGISTYASKPDKVSEHLRPLLDFAKEVVPAEKWTSTPIYLLATAGMRLLPSDEQANLRSETCHYMQTYYSFLINNCKEHVNIISGELEGMYGWIAVNYLMGGFDSANMESNLSAGSKQTRHHTFGFLDMGGASTQIAFEPEHHQSTEHATDLRTIHLRTLDGTAMEFDVFVTTFLGYGSNEARRRYLEERVRIEYEQLENGKENIKIDEDGTLHLADPCLPLDRVTTDLKSTSVPLTLHGTGELAECLRLTLPLLNKKAECPTEPCLFNGVHTPRIDFSVNQFVGISEYWYSAHDILGLGGIYDFVEFEKRSTAFCATNWTTLVEQHRIDGAVAPAVELFRLEMQCFKAAWIVNVLHEGIGIPRIVDPGGRGSEEEKEQVREQSIGSIEAKHWNPPFQSVNTINDIQVSWTLGKILIEATSEIPLLDPSDPLYRPGHSTDDEGDHDDSVIVGNGDRIMNWSSEATPPQITSSYGRTYSRDQYILMLGVLLCCLCVLWAFTKRNKRRRPDAGANGGILGVSGISGGGFWRTVQRMILMSRLRMLRSASSIRWGGNTWTAVPTSSFADPESEIEIPPNIQSSVNIQNGLQRGQAFPVPNKRPPPPNKTSRSLFWTAKKKRMSGDSNSFNLPGLSPKEPYNANFGNPESTTPIQRTGSLSNIANSSLYKNTDMAVRTGSSSNLSSLATNSSSSSPPIASPHPTTPISIPKNRGWVIYEEDNSDTSPTRTATDDSHSQPQQRQASYFDLPGGEVLSHSTAVTPRPSSPFLTPQFRTKTPAFAISTDEHGIMGGGLNQSPSSLVPRNGSPLREPRGSSERGGPKDSKELQRGMTM